MSEPSDGVRAPSATVFGLFTVCSCFVLNDRFASSPAAGDDATRSFRTKTLQTVRNPATVADGARTPSLGALTFPIVLKHVSDMATVDDPTLLKTMFYLWERLKLVVEPTGALAAAAALEGTTPIQGRRVGVILSGGNVDLAQVGKWVQYR